MTKGAKFRVLPMPQALAALHALSPVTADIWARDLSPRLRVEYQFLTRQAQKPDEP